MAEYKSNRGIPHEYFWDDDWLAMRTEEVIEPDLPIVDAHHHFWQRKDPYFAAELLEDIQTGHMIRGTVYTECHSMYRADGDPRFSSVGEVEFANGIAASFASGFYGDLRMCAGIVGRVDLSMGALAGEVLGACLARAPDRFRGIRQIAGWVDDPDVTFFLRPPPKDLLLDPDFRAGFATLAPLGLSYDALVWHPQLPQLIDLVDAFPNTRVIVNHLGGPVRIGRFADDLDATFRTWRESIFELAKRPNVFIKIGAMSMRWMGFDFVDRDLPPTSEELAEAWGPMVETCIEAFGPHRTMFESNYPVDKSGVSYRVLWNAYKRIAAHYSAEEKADLFAGTAIRAYRLPDALGKPPA